MLITEGKNLKVTLDILTKMHYKDFNAAGDKSHFFNPMDLVKNRGEEGDTTGSDEYLTPTEEDYGVDNIVQKHLPKPQDFMLEPY